MAIADDEQRMPLVRRVLVEIAHDVLCHVLIPIDFVFAPIRPLLDFLPGAGHVHRHNPQPPYFRKLLVDFPDRAEEVEHRLIRPTHPQHVPQHVDDRLGIVLGGGEEAVYQRLVIRGKLHVDDSRSICELRRTDQVRVESPVSWTVMNLAQDHDAMLGQRIQQGLLRVLRFALEEVHEGSQMGRRIRNRRAARPADASPPQHVGISQPSGGPARWCPPRHCPHSANAPARVLASADQCGWLVPDTFFGQ